MRADMPHHANLENVVREIAEEIAARTDRGEVASYIPELGNVDPGHFEIGRASCRERVCESV